jgi:hypothetical protein
VTVDPPQTRVHTRYEWDCPGCSEVVDEYDIEPSTGATGVCPHCEQKVTFE